MKRDVCSGFMTVGTASHLLLDCWRSWVMSGSRPRLRDESGCCRSFEARAEQDRVRWSLDEAISLTCAGQGHTSPFPRDLLSLGNRRRIAYSQEEKGDKINWTLHLTSPLAGQGIDCSWRSLAGLDQQANRRFGC